MPRPGLIGLRAAEATRRGMEAADLLICDCDRVAHVFAVCLLWLADRVCCACSPPEWRPERWCMRERAHRPVAARGRRLHPEVQARN